MTVFEFYHPVVAISYVATVLAMTMCAVHPIVVLLSAFAAYVLTGILAGKEALRRAILWQLGAVAFITLLNALFSGNGQTVLADLGGLRITLEALVYGLTLGLLLVGLIQWFSVFSRLVGEGDIFALLAGRLPTMTLALTMTMRLVPLMAKRAQAIAAVQHANQPAANGFVATVRGRARQISVLMGWSMEESLESADSMRARCWGFWRKRGMRRTSYRSRRMRPRDAAALLLLVALVVLCALTLPQALAGWTFYPHLGSLGLEAGYVAFFLLLAYPAFLVLPMRGLLS